MLHIHDGRNVFDAGMDRIRWLFDEFAGKPLAVGTSGGKDSTVVYEMARLVAAERGIELPVMWLDQECEYESTVDYVRWQMHQPGIEPLWMQVPFRLFNTTSHVESWLHVWDPEHPDIWIRPKEPDSYHDNIYGTDRFVKLLVAIGNHHLKGGAIMTGMRAEEAAGRRLALTLGPAYKWVTWSAAERHHLRFSPLYDWTWRDVWKAIVDHGWNYNTHYDRMYQYGVPLMRMRVSNYHHETAVWSLFHLQEIEPETYARATARLAGLHTAAHLGVEDFRGPKRLPFMFDSWTEYRDYLVDHLVQPEHQDTFRRKFAHLRQAHPDAYTQLEETLVRAEITSVIANDIEFVLLNQVFVPLTVFGVNVAKSAVPA